MRYFKRYWSENRGYKFSSWGGATYYFEVDETDFPIRQMEIYDNDIVLKYDRDYLEDEYGGLSEAALAEPEWESYIISQQEFRSTWQSSSPSNQFNELQEE